MPGSFCRALATPPCRGDAMWGFWLIPALALVAFLASEKTLVHFRHATPASLLCCRQGQRNRNTACTRRHAPAPPARHAAADCPPPPVPCSRTARRVFWYLLSTGVIFVLVKWLQTIDTFGMFWVFASAVRAPRAHPPPALPSITCCHGPASLRPCASRQALLPSTTPLETPCLNPTRRPAPPPARPSGAGGVNRGG